MIRHKYGAKPTTKDDIRFDSKAEAAYYSQLKIRLNHDVLFFLRQVPFDLPGGVKYRADFVLFMKDGNVEIIDVKGMDTPMSKMKRKQVEDLYPIEIKLAK